MEFEHAPNDPTRKDLSPLLKLALELGPLGVFFLFNSRGEQIASAFPALQAVGKPIARLSVQTAIGLQWRETTEDAVYVQPNIALAGTAGQGGRWTGAYGQVRTDYTFTSNLSGAIEAVHYDVGQAVRDAGGHDSNYLGVELKFSW